MLNEETIYDIAAKSQEGISPHDDTLSFARAIEAAVRAELAGQEPVAWAYTINNSHSVFSAEKPPEDSYDEGTLYPLYAAPVVQEKQEPVAEAHSGQLRWLVPDDEQPTNAKLFSAPVVQPDMVLVPREPSEAMLEVMAKLQFHAPQERYRAMIAAAEKEK